MRIIKYVLLLGFSLILNGQLKAQDNKRQFLIGKNDTLVNDAGFYLGLLHRHQDFFSKAFSFQGIETAVIINHQLILGVYGSSFVSNLQTEINNSTANIFIWQTGLTIGGIRSEEKALHTGWLINAGYFSLLGDESDFKLFQPIDSDIRANGLIMAPELFAECNISRCMKFRIGLAYSFYSFEDQILITREDLQNISVNFGFVLGKFD